MVRNAEVWIFGNPDFEEDNLPLRLLPELKKRFPGVVFVLKDPNEEWDLNREPTQNGTQTNAGTEVPQLIIIDTVHGIGEVTVFTELNQFQTTPRTTVHDFDLGMKLRWLEKLGLLPPFVIIGVPPELSETVALEQIIVLCRQYVP